MDGAEECCSDMHVNVTAIVESWCCCWWARGCWDRDSWTALDQQLIRENEREKYKSPGSQMLRRSHVASLQIRHALALHTRTQASTNGKVPDNTRHASFPLVLNSPTTNQPYHFHGLCRLSASRGKLSCLSASSHPRAMQGLFASFLVRGRFGQDDAAKRQPHGRQASHVVDCRRVGRPVA